MHPGEMQFICRVQSLRRIFVKSPLQSLLRVNQHHQIMAANASTFNLEDGGQDSKKVYIQIIFLHSLVDLVTASQNHIKDTAGRNCASQKSIVERLDDGEIIVGDGGYTVALEKRNYIKVGTFTPECVVKHPDAVRQLHREFIHGGADVLQAMTFYATDTRLTEGICSFEISDKACQIAKEVASESGSNILVAGCTSPTSVYKGPGTKKAVTDEYQPQIQTFIRNEVDYIVVEYFQYVEELEWAIEAFKQCGLPIVAMMRIGPKGDHSGVPTEECFIRMANAGADIVGLNCCFDPSQSLEGMAMGKKALEEAGIKRHLIVQPLGCWTPDAGKDGYLSLPEAFLALEPRVLTRFDVQKFARDAYDMGIRYIGGCCWFEPYHVRAIAEELYEERGKLPAGSTKEELWGGGLKNYETPWMKARANRQYWENLVPATGRPFSPGLSKSEYKKLTVTELRGKAEKK